jgi:hypothetical protein
LKGYENLYGKVRLFFFILFFFKKEVRNATEAHTALMRGSPYVPRTLQMQLMRINICRVLLRWNQFRSRAGFEPRPFGTEKIQRNPESPKSKKKTSTPYHFNEFKLYDLILKNMMIIQKKRIEMSRKKGQD